MRDGDSTFDFPDAFLFFFAELGDVSGAVGNALHADGIFRQGIEQRTESEPVQKIGRQQVDLIEMQKIAQQKTGVKLPVEDGRRSPLGGYFFGSIFCQLRMIV